MDEREKFASSILPPYLRKTKSVEELLPWLYLKGISTGGFGEALQTCVELRTNDIGITPILEHGKVEAFQVYIGGSQGEKNGRPTFAALGKPFGVFREKDLLPGLDAIVKVHQEWGDRQNRHWARMKYAINKMGIDWYRAQVRSLGADFDLPIADFDHGDRHLHQGWIRQPSNGLWAFGAYIENGRVVDGPNGQLKQMARHLMETYPISVMTTPNQDLLFTGISDDAREPFEADMQRFGHGQRFGKPYSRLRVLSGACVGLYTSRLAYTESEQFEPELIDELKRRGYGDMHESIGITGCERQCCRPATKTIGHRHGRAVRLLQGPSPVRRPEHGLIPSPSRCQDHHPVPEGQSGHGAPDGTYLGRTVPAAVRRLRQSPRTPNDHRG